MYGSYGSYSSMSIPTAPMDIYSSSTLRAHDAACAFPSWPRRSSLADHDEPRATSYLSDDDLFPQDLEDDARSVSSSGSGPTSPASRSPHILTEAELLEMERERHAMQREALRFVIAEKERRRQAMMKKQRRGSSGSKKSPKNKLGAMTPIAEANE